MEAKKKDLSIFVLAGILTIFAIYLSLHMGSALHGTPTETAQGTISIGGSVSTGRASNYMEAFQMAIETMASAPFSCFPPRAESIPVLLVLLGIVGTITAVSYFRGEMRAEVMTKNTNGSAKWCTDYKNYNKDFTTPWEDKEHTPDLNIILSENVKLGMSIQKVDNQRNLNCAIVGGAGTGKSFREIKPNIMQANCSMVVTDPSGELFTCCAKALIKKGYKVKIFSTSDMVHSNCYNPFDYVYDENGEIDEVKVSTLIYLFLKNATECKEKSSGDPFWEKSAKALLTALAYYMLENESMAKENINFTTALKLVQAGKVSEDSCSSESTLDKLMDEEYKMAGQNGRVSRAMSNYKTFKLAPSRTANSILISCAVDLQLFDNVKVQNLTRTDLEEDFNNVHLDQIGDEKTALFINIPQANGTFNFLVAMLYSQLFESLFTKGEKLVKKRWLIKDKWGEPLFTMLSDKETAEAIVNDREKLTVYERSTKRDGKIYQIRNGRKILREVMNENYAKSVIDRLSEAVVEKGYKEKLPFPIRCLMDEFANIGEVPEFTQLLATMRKYNISCTIVLQNIAQLKKMYEKEWEGVLGNCDSKVFLGSSENETCKYFSDLLGKGTIVVRDRGRSFSSKGGNSSQNYKHTARELMTPAELATMSGKKCIVIVRGIDPFMDNKYNFLKHPNYHMTGDANKENEANEEFLDTYYNNTPYSKKVPKKKTPSRKVTQLLKVESKPINSKEELLEAMSSKTEAEFMEKISSSPTITIPKGKVKEETPEEKTKLLKEKPASSSTSPKITDESSIFEFPSF